MTKRPEQQLFNFFKEKEMEKKIKRAEMPQLYCFGLVNMYPF